MKNKAINIARLQKELLSYKFDLEDMEEIRGFNSPQTKRNYEHKLSELNRAKNELNSIIRKNKGASGLYWWNIPWESTVEMLTRNLKRPDDSQGWRFASELCLEGEDNHFLLYLKEEGHFSSFSSTGTEYSYSEVSPYSAEERSDMVKDFNKRIDAFEMYDILTTKGKVYSEEQGRVYDSALSYYMSFEHRLSRKIDSDFYSSLLYKQKETATTNLYSSSRHYTGFYELAGFSVDGGGLVTNVSVGDMKLIAKNGNALNEYSGDAQKAGVMCAAHFSVDNSVKQIPAESFGIPFLSESHDFFEALYCSQIFTCIADKLVYKNEAQPVYLIQSEEEFNRCKELLTKMSQDCELSEYELTRILGYINDNKLPLDDLIIWQMKASCLVRLTLEQEYLHNIYFYASACADVSIDYYKMTRDSFLLLTAVQGAASASNAAIQLDDKSNAAKYARLAMLYNEELLKINPADKELRAIQRDMNRIIKKSEKRRFGLFS